MQLCHGLSAAVSSRHLRLGVAEALSRRGFREANYATGFDFRESGGEKEEAERDERDVGRRRWEGGEWAASDNGGSIVVAVDVTGEHIAPVRGGLSPRTSRNDIIQLAPVT